MKELQEKKTTSNPTETLLTSIIKGLQEKKGEEIIVLNLKNCKNSVADFFIIATGNSKTHVEALARSVDEFVSKNSNEDPWHIEGLANAQWILMDYINIVVHIFQPDTRAFYNLEKLWADAETTVINEPY
jgi:ribosome-associated protein